MLQLQLGRIMDDALQKHYILTGPIRRFCICQRLSIEPNRHPISELIEEYKNIQRLSKKAKIIHCALMLLSELQLGGIMDDALQTHDVLTGHIRRFCFASTMLYVRCVCVLVRKWMGNAIFRKDFIQFVQHYPSTSVSYMTDSTILVWRLLLLFPAAVAAVWQKNSPLLYCLDVLRDQQKKLIHAISILEPHWILQNGQKHERSLRSEKSMISVRFITLEEPKGLKGLDGMGGLEIYGVLKIW